MYNIVQNNIKINKIKSILKVIKEIERDDLLKYSPSTSLTTIASMEYRNNETYCSHLIHTGIVSNVSKTPPNNCMNNTYNNSILRYARVY